ncbi:bifunctional nuclease family protein [Desulfovulcanus sp.]
MFVEMEVVGLALDEQTKVPLIILRDKDEKYILPIWIGALEAVAISMPLNGVTLNRPMTHDLFLNTLETLGVKLEYIEITEIKDSTYFAEVVFLKGEEKLRIDSRPSDAIALALRAKAPIMVSQKILDEIEVEKQEKYQVVLDDEESKKWAEILEKYNLEDIKYKM